MSYILKIAEVQNWRCCYCGHEMFRHRHIDGFSTPANAITKDHVEPRTYGGPTCVKNLIAACYQCNHTRGEMEAIAFYNLLQKWFRRTPHLRSDWHHLTHKELFILRHKCMAVHERQLAGIARFYIEYAFRHMRFVDNNQTRLTTRA